MKERIAYTNVTPQLMKSVNTIDKHLKNSALNSRLLELIKYRVSQINGCAFFVWTCTTRKLLILGKKSCACIPCRRGEDAPFNLKELLKRQATVILPSAGVVKLSLINKSMLL